MAGADVILSRLCDLQGTNFEVVDCQVKEDEIVWRIQYKAEAQYICPRCGAVNDVCHDNKWIKLRATFPLGERTAHGWLNELVFYVHVR